MKKSVYISIVAVILIIAVVMIAIPKYSEPVYELYDYEDFYGVINSEFLVPVEEVLPNTELIYKILLNPEKRNSLAPVGYSISSKNGEFLMDCQPFFEFENNELLEITSYINNNAIWICEFEDYIQYRFNYNSMRYMVIVFENSEFTHENITSIIDDMLKNRI